MNYSKDDISILISTMNRSDFSFLDAMFPHHEWRDLNLVIVNQTKKGQKLKSELENIIAINSYDVGLSKSRNLALKNCRTTYGVIADDDVFYHKDFINKILQAHNQYRDAVLICHQIQTSDIDNIYKKYSKSKFLFKGKSDEHFISSIEMSVQIDLISKHNLAFNTHFGLGTEFPMGEEQLILKDILNKNLKAIFIPQYIVSHEYNRSTSDRGNDNYIKAKSALKYIEYADFAKLWLFKFLFFLLRKSEIKLKDIPVKFRVGLKAIAKIKKINNSND